MDITTKTTTELEALAYQQIVIRDNATRNLQIIQGEIDKRAQVAPETAEEKPAKKKND